MATGPQFVAALAHITGVHTATLDRYLRNLGEAGLIRRSGKGGGKAAVHLLMYEYVTMLLSLAAIHPSGAAHAATTLEDLRDEDPATNFVSLKVTLGMAVQLCAMEIMRGSAGRVVSNDWTLTLCLDPPQAWMSWPPHNPAPKRVFRAEQLALLNEPAAPALMRHTVITKPLLMLVAEHCATWNDNAAPLPGGTASRRA